MNKILKIIFFILFLVLIFEVVYIFLMNSSTTSGLKINTQNTFKEPLELSPTSSKVDFLSQAKQIEYYYQMSKSGVLLSSTSTDKIKGEILSIDKDGGVSDIYKIPYKFKIEIGNQGGNSYPLYFGKNGFEKTKIYKNDLETDLAPDSLKIGEKIEMTLTYDNAIGGDYDNLIDAKIYINNSSDNEK